MDDLLLTRPSWYLAGPLIGLLVVGLFASINERLAVLGGYSEIVANLGRRPSFGWRAVFVFGVVAGSVGFSLVGGVWRTGDEYGWLSRALANDGAVAAVLLGAGILIGVGAKTAGGCTSGNGLSGCSFGSPASFVATATFMSAAIATAFLARLVLGAGT